MRDALACRVVVNSRHVTMTRRPTFLLLLPLFCLLPAKTEARDHWAFQIPVRQELPLTSAENPIDAFIRAKLEGKKLPDSPEADPHTLLRRLHLDLTGLLPTAEEALQFLNDASPQKRDALIDRLLETDSHARFWALKTADLMRVNTKLLPDGRA